MQAHASLSLKLSLIACLLFLVANLNACVTTPVHVVHPQQFTLMSHRMPQELVARKLITQEQRYTVASAPLGSVDYGTLLYTKLNADFLSDHVASTSNTTFAATLSPKEKVETRATGFSIFSTAVPTSSSGKKQYGSAGRRVDVDIVAVSDWENDGVQDWILTCRYIKNYGAYPRVYYMVIPQNISTPIQSQGILQSTVVAIYEEAGPKGRVYLRESKALNKAQVHDVLPGLKNVTEPPSAKSSVTTHDVTERDL